MDSLNKIILAHENPGHCIVYVLLGRQFDSCRARITTDAMWEGLSVYK